MHNKSWEKLKYASTGSAGANFGKFVVDCNSHQKVKLMVSLNSRSAGSFMFAAVSLRLAAYFNLTRLCPEFTVT